MSSAGRTVRSSPGTANYYSQGQGANTSTTVGGLPTDGSTVHVRFFFKVDGVWSPGTDYTYTAFNAPPPPAGPSIVGPVPGSTLTDAGGSETFTWDSMGLDVEAYSLVFGSTVGGAELGRSGALSGNQTDRFSIT